MGQFIFKSGLIRLKPTKLGHKAQVVGDGLFKPNKALEGNGVLGELADIEVGVTVQAPEVKIDTGIPQADAAKDGDVQAKLLLGNRVEENGLDGSGGIGSDRTELRKSSRNQLMFGASVLQLKTKGKPFGLPANRKAGPKSIVKAHLQFIPAGQDPEVVFFGFRPDAHGSYRPRIF